MLQRLLIVIGLMFVMSGCSVKQETLNTKPEKMEHLTQD